MPLAGEDARVVRHFENRQFGRFFPYDAQLRRAQILDALDGDVLGCGAETERSRERRGAFEDENRAAFDALGPVGFGCSGARRDHFDVAACRSRSANRWRKESRASLRDRRRRRGR